MGEVTLRFSTRPEVAVAEGDQVRLTYGFPGLKLYSGPVVLGFQEERAQLEWPPHVKTAGEREAFARAFAELYGYRVEGGSADG